MGYPVITDVEYDENASVDEKLSCRLYEFETESDSDLNYIMTSKYCYGVIVSKGFRRGLLLPDLDGIDTPEEQVAIARKKAGIGAGEAVKLERFEVVRHR